MTERKKEIYRRLNQPIPDEVEPDYISECILNIYALASRARRYTESGVLPLSVADVKAVFGFAPCPIDEWLVLECVFALDDMDCKRANEAIRAKLRHR
ncbi:hypothetical protein B0181_05070 [Moraxella caviae]|uniref:Uncharacterized protein n=1 Tax=Moraxella caviae TaxID=34060 RepID=A0A1T0A3H0_9GAMM|nr:hypothetical protein [Moraxella caviae]OOR90245.1 hypothetical protein B0181_05070 [Moraxella caviae]STZ14530.1 Uncharacterised protein [Moraxella caviae]VEW12535.1 Uncharacterised protein [Moraxella caviae]